MGVKPVTGKKVRRCYRLHTLHGDHHLMRKILALAFAVICGGALGAMLGLGASLVF
jgi:hypothetical protein